MKAIELYIKYDRSAAAVIHELGYPGRKLLPRWYAEYLQKQQASWNLPSHNRTNWGQILGENTPQNQQNGASEKSSGAPLLLNGAADKI